MVKPYYDRDGITIYHGDCREILPSIGPVDLVLTDPPYGIESGAAFVRQGGAMVDSGNHAWNIEVPDWGDLAARTVKPGGYFAFFYNFRANPNWPDAVASWGSFFWVKPAPAPCPRNAFMSGVEVCAIGILKSGKRAWNGGGAYPNFWIGLSPNRLMKGCGHPAEKPVQLIVKIMVPLSMDNDTVLDPFMGSGTTLRAAKDLGNRHRDR